MGFAMSGKALQGCFSFRIISLRIGTDWKVVTKIRGNQENFPDHSFS